MRSNDELNFMARYVSGYAGGRIGLTSKGLRAGDHVTVTLELDEGVRVVDVPVELQAALQDEGLAEKFEALSYSARKEHARQVDEAKSDGTKQRRITKVLDQLR